MGELIAGLVELIASVVQVVGEVLVAILASTFRSIFSKTHLVGGGIVLFLGFFGALGAATDDDAVRQ